MVDKKLTKSVGEHWVCSVMAGLGWAPALTRDGLERTDLLAVHATSALMLEVQVKAASFHRNPSWLFGDKTLAPARSQHEWFVLVVLPECAWEAPTGYVVPRDHVSAGYWISYQDWISEPGIPAGKRNVRIGGARTFAWVFERYKNRWDLLEEPADTVPVLLPESFRGLAEEERVGLPPTHPWQERLPRW